MEQNSTESSINWELLYSLSHTIPNYFLKTAKQSPHSKLSKLDIKIERMSGLSNCIYKLSPKEKNPNAI